MKRVLSILIVVLLSLTLLGNVNASVDNGDDGQWVNLPKGVNLTSQNIDRIPKTIEDLPDSPLFNSMSSKEIEVAKRNAITGVYETEIEEYFNKQDIQHGGVYRDEDGYLVINLLEDSSSEIGIVKSNFPSDYIKYRTVKYSLQELTNVENEILALMEKEDYIKTVGISLPDNKVTVRVLDRAPDGYLDELNDKVIVNRVENFEVILTVDNFGLGSQIHGNSGSGSNYRPCSYGAKGYEGSNWYAITASHCVYPYSSYNTWYFDFDLIGNVEDRTSGNTYADAASILLNSSARNAARIYDENSYQRYNETVGISDVDWSGGSMNDRVNFSGGATLAAGQDWVSGNVTSIESVQINQNGLSTLYNQRLVNTGSKYPRSGDSVV